MLDLWSLKWLGLIMAFGGLGLFLVYWRQFRQSGGLIAAPFAWMGALYLLPILILVYMSFGTKNLQNQPPFDPPLSFGQEEIWTGSTDSYEAVATDLWQGTQKCLGGVCLGEPQFKYRPAFINSLTIAIFTSTLAVVIGFPFALAIARAPERFQGLLLMGVILPFWSFYIIRVYAFRQLVRDTGPINEGINAFNGIAWLPDLPNLALYPSAVGMVLALVYTYLPFAILPLYATLQSQDRSLEEAAADLGARPLQRFWRITIPLAAPGLVAAFLLVGIPTMGEYVIPEIMSQNDLALGKGILGLEIQKAMIGSEKNWPLGALLGILLMLILVVPMVLYQRNANRLALQEAGN